MKVKVIASGSTGNCTYVETKDHKILIDTGISKKGIEVALNSIEVEFKEIDTVLITHEHDDHIRSLSAVLKKSEIMCYMTEGTYKAIINGKNEVLKKTLAERLESNYIILLNRLNKCINYPDILLDETVINVLPTFHDALEPVGYKISCLDKSVVYITDTGYVHNSLYETICDSDCYVLEFNHDPQVLMASDRSLNLKRRILSDHGHLSNEDAFVTLSKIMGEKTRLVFYAHISQECNLVEIIELTRKKVMSSLGINDEAIKYIVTSPISTEVYEI
jgi:phosphoribosyl 1,2-cyclic phosphodiesterase